MKLTHPDRPSPQYAFSERDIAALEKMGWTSEKPVDLPVTESQVPDTAQALETGDGGVTPIQVINGPIIRKRGRPVLSLNKAKECQSQPTQS